MTEDQFDSILATAAPATAERTEVLRHAMNGMIADAEDGVGKKGRRPGRMGVVAIVATGLLGGAVGAQAGGLFRPEPTTGEWSGERAAVHVNVEAPGIAPCQASYMIVPREQGTESRTPDEWDRVWSTATGVLEQTDPSTLQSPAIRQKYRRSLAPQSAAERTDADIWTSSIGAELRARVDAELRLRGLPDDMLLMSQAHDCDPDAF